MICQCGELFAYGRDEAWLPFWSYSCVFEVPPRRFDDLHRRGRTSRELVLGLAVGSSTCPVQ